MKGAVLRLKLVYVKKQNFANCQFNTLLYTLILFSNFHNHNGSPVTCQVSKMIMAQEGLCSFVQLSALPEPRTWSNNYSLPEHIYSGNALKFIGSFTSGTKSSTCLRQS